MLSAKFGIPSASTGALLREERARGTALGREADAWTAQGRFFTDEIAIRVVHAWLTSHGAEAFLLDGFPRTLGQATAFDTELAAMGSALDVVFHLKLSDEAIRERVAGRITCTHCGASFSMDFHHVSEGDSCPACGERLVRRRDDTPAALEERLAQHRLNTEPVIDFYRDAGRLTEVDSSSGRDAVFGRLCEIIEEAVPA
jgi:adenylate kinase